MSVNPETTAAALESEGFDHNLVVDATRSAILSLMLADLRLRTRQPKGLSRMLSSRVLIAPALRAKLQFVARVDKNRKIFFGLVRRSKSKKVADVRINLELRPRAPLSPERSIDLAFVFAMPDFILNPEDPVRLTLKLSNGQRLPMALEKPRNDKTASDYAQVALMLTEWARVGASYNLYTLRLDHDNETGQLITTVKDDFGKIWSIDLTGTGSPPTGASQQDRAIWKDIVASQTHLKKFDPFLAGDYELAALRARALVMLDRDGKLVDRIGAKGARQVDLDIGLGSAAGRQVAILKMSIPDILVKGSRWSVFVEKLAELAGDALWRQLKRQSSAFSSLGIDLEQEDVNRLVSGDNRQVSFVRLEVGSDNDLVILQGMLSGVAVTLLVTANFKVTDYPDITVERISDVKLLAVSSLESGWIWTGNADKTFFEYFESLLRMLRDWQHFTGAPVAHSQVA